MIRVPFPCFSWQQRHFVEVILDFTAFRSFEIRRLIDRESHSKLCQPDNLPELNFKIRKRDSLPTRRLGEAVFQATEPCDCRADWGLVWNTIVAGRWIGQALSAAWRTGLSHSSGTWGSIWTPKLRGGT